MTFGDTGMDRIGPVSRGERRASGVLICGCGWDRSPGAMIPVDRYMRCINCGLLVAALPSQRLGVRYNLVSRDSDLAKQHRGEPYRVPIRPLQTSSPRWVGWIAVLCVVAFVGAVVGIARWVS